MAPALDITVADCKLQFSDSLMTMDTRCKAVLEAAMDGLRAAMPDLDTGEERVTFVVILCCGLVAAVVTVAGKYGKFRINLTFLMNSFVQG